MTHNIYELTLERKYSVTTYVDNNNIRHGYTIGNLYDSDGTFICNTLEDVDRGLDDKMEVNAIRYLKKPGITAIPTGRYEITYTWSPKFSKQMPLLNGVKGFSAIRIHPGNTDKDTEGCILVGMNRKKGQVLDSQVTFMKLNDILKGHIKSGDKVYIKIVANFK